MNRSAILAGLLLLASGCATRGSVHQLEADLGTAKKAIAALEESQDRNSREQARLVADVKSLQERVREVQGTTSEATAELTRLRSRIDSAEEAIKQTRADLEARPQLVAAPAPSPPPEKPREVTNRAAETAFNAALATFRAREHGQAVLDFLDFIAKYPKHPLTSTAQFWIAEAYFVQRDYRQALTEYQKVSELGPGAPKGPDALLRISQCYTRLHEPGRAQEALQTLVHGFPQSPAAARARTLLRARR